MNSPEVVGVLVNGTTPPAPTFTVSRLTSLEVSFNTEVSAVDPDAFTLTNGVDTIVNGGGGAISVAGFGTATLTLTFTGSTGVNFGSLADGVWTLTTDLTKVQNANSAAGTVTADTTDIRRLYGDVDGNGTVDLTDFGFFGNAFGQAPGDPGWNPVIDWDVNGTIDLTDFGEFGNRFGQSI